MHNEILDANYHNPDTWDSKKRVVISDAIIEVNDHVRKVKYGRYFLFIMAAMNFTVPILELLTADQLTPSFLFATMVVAGIIVVPLLVFGILYRTNPLLFLVLGLFFYLAALVFSVLAGQGLFDGYAIKVGVIAAFSFAIFSAISWKRNIDRLRELGYPSSALAEARKSLKPLPRLRKRKV